MIHLSKAGSAAHRLVVMLVLTISAAHSHNASAQQRLASIQFDAAARVFRIDAGDSTYAFGTNEKQALQSLYWGSRLAVTDHFPAAHTLPEASSFDSPTSVTPQEFAGWGGGLYVEPDLKISFPDGNRDLVLQYVSHQIDGNKLSILLKDIERQVYVMLHYEVDGETGILSRFATVENRTSAPLILEQIAAGTWSLPRGEDYRLRYLTGRWAGEWNVKQQRIQPGKTVLESRRGTTGAQNNPWFAIDRSGNDDQDQGEVWFGALGWSGTWQLTIEQDQVQQVRVTGGSNAFDFGYLLKAGASLTTPTFYGGYSEQGIGGASRLMHRFEIDAILPHHPAPKLRPVLYDSWEATGLK